MLKIAVNVSVFTLIDEGASAKTKYSWPCKKGLKYMKREKKKVMLYWEENKELQHKKGNRENVEIFGVLKLLTLIKHCKFTA